MSPGERGQARRCTACDAELAPRARFCGRCGAPTVAGVLELDRRERGEAWGATRLVLGLVTALVGVLATIVLATWLATSSLAPLVRVAAWNAALVAVGAGAAGVLGGGALRSSLGRGSGGSWLAVGAASGLGTLLVGWGWVALVEHLTGPGAELGEEGPAWVIWIAVALAPPLLEEWLCRGVLWEAVRRAAGERSALVATAVLFAMLHGPTGGLLGLPHRLLAGAVFGWLRLRSGSLLPSVAAHAVNNALALALLGG